MNLEIILNNHEISILLKNKNELIEKMVLKEMDRLSDTLLAGMENMIRKNKLSKEQIKNISVKSNLPDSYTSARIAKSIAKTFVFAKKSK